MRQPARAMLGVLGVAAVGALLFDMLLLSQGLVISMRDLLDRTGFEIRVESTDQLPGLGPPLDDAAAIAAEIAVLGSVRSAITIRMEVGTLEQPGERRVSGSLIGVGGGPAHPWIVIQGRDLEGDRELVISRYTASRMNVEPGDSIVVRGSCQDGNDVPPPVTFVVAGVAEFPLDSEASATAATTAAGLADACSTDDMERADFIVVTSTGDVAAAAADISAILPDLRTMTNEQAVGRFQQGGFTYFSQISAVLSAVTVSFALLLITVLLTVSVNQRLGELAALRAIGFTRGRLVRDVLAESALLVSIGGALSLPLGSIMASWLDGILKDIPGLPVNLHFFVFEPQALWVHGALLTATALLAALYPMCIVARLPIAATLRNEVIT